MKKQIIISLLIFCSLLGKINAQDTLQKKKYGLNIKTDILWTALDLAVFERSVQKQFSAEFYFGSRYSVQIDITKHSEIIRNHIVSPSTSFLFAPEFRFYLSKKNHLEGFYTGVYSGIGKQWSIRLFEPSGKVAQEETENNLVVLGGLFGYQRNISERFLIDISIGGGVYRDFNYKPSNLFSQNDKFGPSAMIFFQIGYRLF